MGVRNFYRWDVSDFETLVVLYAIGEGRIRYPRERGGTLVTVTGVTSELGLSPRARGNGHRNTRCARLNGSIPASAGERENGPAYPCRQGVYPRERGGTLTQPVGHRVFRVYPRERGGTENLAMLRLPEEGLSPRARGNAV